MTSQEKAYKRKLEELLKATGHLTDVEVGRVQALLKDAADRIRDAIASTEWEAYRIQQFKEAVERAISAFSQQYQTGFADASRSMWEAGIEAVEHPLQFAGISVMTAAVNREALEILQGYSADLITNLSVDAIKRITAEITLGILGEKSPWEVMSAIGTTLKGGGVMAGISHRAETIARTEMARIHSLAREARMRMLVDENPAAGWKKKWISSGKAHPREWHRKLNGMIVDMDKKFPGGILYPHAPGLPAKEVINCGCTHVLTCAAWERDSELTRYDRPIETAIYD